MRKRPFFFFTYTNAVDVTGAVNVTVDVAIAILFITVQLLLYDSQQQFELTSNENHSFYSFRIFFLLFIFDSCFCVWFGLIFQKKKLSLQGEWPINDILWMYYI